MRSTLKLALLMALSIEVVNFWLIGYPAATHPLSKASQYPAVALQWDVLHLPGIILSDRIVFLREHPSACSVALWISGFLDTAILLAFLIWISRLALRALRKRSSPLTPAH